MAGVKGRSGGRRRGAGRKAGPPRSPKRRLDPETYIGTGRGKFVPNEAQHSLIQLAKAIGFTVGQMLPLIINPHTKMPINQATFFKHFKTDLDRGYPVITSRIAGALIKNALEGNERAQEFYLTRIAKWTETLNITIRRPDEMTDEELDAAIAAADASFGNGSTSEGATLSPTVAPGESPTRH